MMSVSIEAKLFGLLFSTKTHNQDSSREGRRMHPVFSTLSYLPQPNGLEPLWLAGRKARSFLSAEKGMLRWLESLGGGKA